MHVVHDGAPPDADDGNANRSRWRKRCAAPRTAIRNAFQRAGRALRRPAPQTSIPATAWASASAPSIRIWGSDTTAIIAIPASAPTAKNPRPHSNHRSLTQNAAAAMADSLRAIDAVVHDADPIAHAQLAFVDFADRERRAGIEAHDDPIPILRPRLLDFVADDGAAYRACNRGRGVPRPLPNW